ncbi:class I SAM-dependent methyltransferase [Streptomyces armeniacus]|uniref:Class I SAM-dependent methyltransferase n=1 Tax=Streptomyces armeniacus TaxID=83291 RepID=A0A345XUA4_9ACTN|nr:class I SAM-dependent methyltransferase [Streptomyces armeniacus]AXK35220.1 class I SAM-dependent methyltransferase [Streptomyces armeniacus]
MTLGFSGDVAAYYAEFRRGYPPPVLGHLCAAFGLGAADTVLDLGCGTGQLTVPLAARTGSVIGMDPEPDMLSHARAAAENDSVRNVIWVLGGDADVPALGALLGGRPLAMTVIGQALHWMDHERLFRTVRPLLRTGGGIAVVANGTPLWLQDSDWSRALRGFLEEHFGSSLEASCGTGTRDRERYAEALRAAGYAEVRETDVAYTDDLDFGRLLGGVYSAMSAADLPAPDERPAFAARLRAALPPGERFTEQVTVTTLTGHA